MSGLIAFVGWLWRLRRQYVPRGSQPSEEQIKAFYQYEWPAARYKAIKRFKKPGWRCGACNRKQDEGAVICIDHIKPVRRYWHLRLEQSNLQPLCRPCNWGKGSWDETDWRPRRLGLFGLLKK
jgi:5-methylcytosine-specific restriction endonuclease McrA